MNDQKAVTDLCKEENRLKTFNQDWPHAFISPTNLAKTGFYYIGPHDQVECYFCKVRISSWEMGDNEEQEHERWSLNCPFLKRREMKNISLESTQEWIIQLSNSIGSHIREIERRKGSYVETSFFPKKMNWPKPDYPDYMDKADRLKTFDKWPKILKQDPEEMADAGFFYTNKEDRVICFYCGGGLREWNDHDVPFEEHAKWFSQCQYLIMVKGTKYIKNTKNQDVI